MAAHAASRGCLDHLAGLQYRPATDVVAAALDAFPANQIDFPPKQIRMLVLHAHVIEQTPSRAGAKGHQHDHVTVRLEIPL